MKYIVFALVLVAFVANFGVSTIAQRLFGKELDEMQIVLGKLICFALALAGVVFIIFFA